MTTKNGKDIIANKSSKLALKYIYCENKYIKQKIFDELSLIYMPKIRSMMSTVQKQDRDDFIQIYYYELLNALSKWNQKSNFSTYLFPYIISVYRKFMSNLKMFKKDINCVSLDALDIDIDYELDTWDKIYNEGSSYYTQYDE